MSPQFAYDPKKEPEKIILGYCKACKLFHEYQTDEGHVVEVLAGDDVWAFMFTITDDWSREGSMGVRKYGEYIRDSINALLEQRSSKYPEPENITEQMIYVMAEWGKFLRMWQSEKDNFSTFTRGVVGSLAEDLRTLMKWITTEGSI